MSVECTSCGQLIAEGQVRCGKCGTPAPLDPAVADVGAPKGNPGMAAQSPAAAALAASVAANAVPRVILDELHEVAAEAPVPKGTFASVAPQPTPALVARPEAIPEIRPLAAPRELVETAPARSAAMSSSQRIKEMRAPVRPPFLASESLREDLSPLWPGKQEITHTLQLAGLLGALASVLVAFDQPVGWLCAITCALIAGLSRVELEYMKRALIAATVSGSALLLASFARVALGAGGDDPLLSLACSLLPAALLFRSWYRGARVARALVALTLVLAFAWVGLTSNRGLLSLGFTWQSWLPALAWSSFSILCLLSLLAFMGDETTGGCHVWAYGISLWFGLFACLRWAMEREGSPASGGPSAALGLTEAALASVLAIALAQLGSRLYVARSRLMPNVS